MFYGMHLALRGNFQNVEFESDSSSLIHLLQDADVSLHPLGTVINNCKSLSTNFQSCTFRHIHRERNIVADILAKASLSNGKDILWLDEAPSAITNAMTDDIAGIAQMRKIAMAHEVLNGAVNIIGIPHDDVNATHTNNHDEANFVGERYRKQGSVFMLPSHHDATANTDLRRHNVARLRIVPDNPCQDADIRNEARNVDVDDDLHRQDENDVTDANGETCYQEDTVTVHGAVAGDGEAEVCRHSGAGDAASL